MSSLHTKYRPETFDEVVGQGAVVASLIKVIQRRKAQTFLFSGPSGTGKTTLARICATELGCDPTNLLEVDAATNSGIDDMRGVQERLRYKAFGKNKVRATIIDEAHGLSKNAWNSLLKVTEEPPPDTYWFFCTTEPHKVVSTIRTRAVCYTLKPVKDEDIEQLLAEVAATEKYKTGTSVISMIAKEAMGSPRQALQFLEQCASVTDRKEAARIIQVALESDAQLALCKFLLDGRGSWTKVMSFVSKLQDENPESVRIVICNYMASVLRNTNTDKQATHVLGVLDAFATPYNQAEGFAPLYLSIGRVLFSE